MTSRKIAIAGFVILVGSGVYGYYRDPLGSLPVILMVMGFFLMLIGFMRPSKNKSGAR